MKADINEQLIPLARRLSELTPDAGNSRDHSLRNIEAIRDSLSQFGQQKCIVVDGNDTIVAGNGTYFAAKELGWDHLAATIYDGKGDPDAFALADNRTAELAEWNYEHLTARLQSLQERGFDLDKLGWKDYELEPLFAADWAPPAITGEGFEAAEKTETIKVSKEQWMAIEQAIKLMRQASDEPDMSDGRALELLCKHYMEEQTDAKEG
jgi:hypothetical protein